MKWSLSTTPGMKKLHSKNQIYRSASIESVLALKKKLHMEKRKQQLRKSTKTTTFEFGDQMISR